MTFKKIEGITHADYAYEVEGKNLSELFSNAGLAVGDAMADLETVEAKEEKVYEAKDDDVEVLLHDFLDEIVYYKDAELLIFSEIKAEVKEVDGEFELKAVLKGEKIDYKKHKMETDVKAVTYHEYSVREKDGKWAAVIVLDV